MARRRRCVPLPAAAALIAVLAGCASGTDEPTVASAATAGPTASAAASPDSVARYVEAQRRWVKCLREQGFADVPDPDDRGRVDLNAHGGRSKTDPAWVAALTQCRLHLIEIPAELEPRENPLTPEQLGWRREFAKCMRANGMPQWPDPGPDGQWPEGSLSGELTEQEQAANIRALQICEPVGQGRPPGTPDPHRTGVG